MVWCRLALLLVLCCTAGLALAQEVITLDRAQASLRPDGLPPRVGEVDLSRRWDIDFPGRDGSATYRMALPPRSTPEPMALLFSRVGNQVLVQVNGATVQRLGTLGEPRFNAAKTAYMVTVPAALLHADRPNELTVEVTIQRQRWGGLSLVRYGTQAAVEPLYAEHRRWRHFSSIVFAVSLTVMGGLVGGLWWRQRDALYGCFSVAAFLGVVRNLDQVWPDVPVPWPLWGAIAAVCYACHLALICRFALLALGAAPAWAGRAIYAAMALSSLLAVASFAFSVPLFWTLGLAVLVPVGVGSLAIIVRATLRGRGRFGWVLVVAAVIAVGAGIYDLGFIRASHSTGLRFSTMPHAIFVFVLIMAGLVAERYSRSVADYRALNANLAQRVAEREQQLHQAFGALQTQQQEQAVLTERQRIMREIHDGVGSQLVGLLSMVSQRGTDPAVLEEHVKQALDEMRMAVDSLQPVHGDLIAVLATLRYRLQPRLQAAGVQVLWDVSQLPPLPQLSPQSVLQVQRILLEAFTNVLKHARATEVAVQARWESGEEGATPAVVLSLTDNGVGLPSEQIVGGHGVANMQSRAAAIGAVLRVEAGENGGTRVVLHWPIKGPPP
ncbi:MAG: sensor histidine kinase [Rhizobacter sp.]|nr:sensor histidine kinase [Rhizobacter sp.]